MINNNEEVNVLEIHFMEAEKKKQEHAISESQGNTIEIQRTIKLT